MLRCCLTHALQLILPFTTVSMLLVKTLHRAWIKALQLFLMKFSRASTNWGSIWPNMLPKTAAEMHCHRGPCLCESICERIHQRLFLREIFQGQNMPKVDQHVLRYDVILTIDHCDVRLQQDLRWRGRINGRTKGTRRSSNYDLIN